MFHKTGFRALVLPSPCANSCPWHLIFVEFWPSWFIHQARTKPVRIYPSSQQWYLLFLGNESYFCAFLLQVLHAHLAAADPCSKLSCFQGFWGRGTDKLLWLFDGREPEAVFVCKVMARPSGTVAFNERSSAEILQARTRWDEGLTSTFCTSCCVLNEDVYLDEFRGPEKEVNRAVTQVLLLKGVKQATSFIPWLPVTGFGVRARGKEAKEGTQAEHTALL